MKASDKLLTAFFGLSLLTLCTIQGFLYFKYKRGEITQNKVMLEEAFTKYDLPYSSSPLTIFVKGFQQVNIIPSDSLYFMLEKNGGEKAVYKVINDTVYLEGGGTIRSDYTSAAQSPQVAISNGQAKAIKLEAKLLPELNQQALLIYYPNNGKIWIEDGESFIHGSISPGRFNLELSITNCHVELGNDNSIGDQYLNRFYNNLVIHSINSGISMNSKSAIKILTITMNDQSILSDNAAMIDSIAINCSGQSRLELSGKNIKKARFFN
jgi:hypothetical protein